jgi:hypothetical protein
MSESDVKESCRGRIRGAVSVFVGKKGDVKVSEFKPANRLEC